MAGRVEGTDGSSGQLVPGGFKGGQGRRRKSRVRKEQAQDGGQRFKIFRGRGASRIQAEFRLGNDSGDLSQFLGTGQFFQLTDGDQAGLRSGRFVNRA
ncbi:MAG: hypothetical protein LBP80_08735 [Treponema sp.]|nr:hypothetical protein [Treponema sp.]